MAKCKCKKRKFTKEQAENIIIKCYYQSHILNNKNRKEQRYYLCDICGKYHLTSKPETTVKKEK